MSQHPYYMGLKNYNSCFFFFFFFFLGGGGGGGGRG